MLFAAQTIHNFNCERIDANQGSCRFEEIKRGHQEFLRVIPVNTLQGAGVENNVKIEESSRLQDRRTGKIQIKYRLSLLLNSGESLLLDSGSNIGDYQKISNEISRFVKAW